MAPGLRALMEMLPLSWYLFAHGPVPLAFQAMGIPVLGACPPLPGEGQELQQPPGLLWC